MEIKLPNPHSTKPARTVAFPGRSLGLLAAIVAVLACDAAAAQAAERADDAPPRVVVRYADLDIAHEAGARILRQRLATAASRVCGDAPDVRLLASTARFKRCQQAALARAMTDLSGQAVMLAQSGAAPAGPAVR